MKKKLFSIFLFLLSLLPLFSDAQPNQEISQFLIPKRIYVGDIAELNYNFRSSLELFEENPEENEKNLDIFSLPFSCDTEDFTLHSLILKRNGEIYTAVFKFTPWVTGYVTIPPFDLLSVMGKKSAVPLEIKSQSIAVQSILASGTESELKPCAGPLLLPGTIYFVWGMLILFALLLALLVIIFIHREKIVSGIKNLALLSFYARNAQRALRELKRLEAKSEKFSAVEFSLLFQKILRKYLSGRLGLSFDSITSSKITSTCDQAFGGFLEGERLEAVEEVEGLFKRADYVRFAGKNQLLDSKERNYFIQTSRKLIMLFEKNNSKEEKDA
ncbi:MAG: hypothetical protein K6E78_04095 [Treponema sp.]|nr:hypothetical protein [Treponema sp.]